jgi:hypothetical protein
MPDTLGLDPYLNIDSNATIELIGSGVLRHCGLGRARSNEGRSCMLFKSAQFLFAFLPGALRHIPSLDGLATVSGGHLNLPSARSVGLVSLSKR